MSEVGSSRIGIGQDGACLAGGAGGLVQDSPDQGSDRLGLGMHEGVVDQVSLEGPDLPLLARRQIDGCPTADSWLDLRGVLQGIYDRIGHGQRRQYEPVATESQDSFHGVSDDASAIDGLLLAGWTLRMDHSATDKLFADVFERMLKAGWLESFTFTDGKGWHLTWGTDGGSLAVSLKRWIDLLGLDQADERPVLAYVIASGLGLHPDSSPETVNGFLALLMGANMVTDARFNGGVAVVKWTVLGEQFRAEYVPAIETLGIEDDFDRILVWVHAIEGWAPSESSKVRFV
jgi:hypothetical protein